MDPERDFGKQLGVVDEPSVTVTHGLLGLEHEFLETGPLKAVAHEPTCS